MSHRSAVPFVVERSSAVWRSDEITSKTELAHGLLLLDDDRLVVQWRLAVKTETYGSAEISSDEEVAAVQEVVIPLGRVADAAVRRRWWEAFSGGHLVLTGADLRAFESLAGGEGLRLGHPAKLELKIRREDLLAARELVADLSLALAQLPHGPEEGPKALRRPT